MQRGLRFAHAAVARASVLAVCVFACARVDARDAQPATAGSTAPSASPAPNASAAPAPAATPTSRPLGLRQTTDISGTSIDQSTNGPGRFAPEATGFIMGSPLAPNTPYDLFSSAPEVPGVAGIARWLSTATYGFKRFEASVTGGFGYAVGSVTNAAYWGESLFPTLNPHLGAQALPYTIAFPSHAGQDNGSAFRASITGGALATADGALQLRGGYLDLAQTDRFVFAQPALTNVAPTIAVAPAESLSNGLPSLGDWAPESSQLPLHGIDAMVKRGDATFELTSAALPSLPGESARLGLGSLVLDRGEGTRFSAELAHVTTSGLAFATTVPFGANPAYATTPQGILPTSTLDGQRQTVAGLRAAFHISTTLSVDGVVEIGRAWYDASDAAMPGSGRPGGYYHVGITQTHGRATASLDVYRMEPRYATIILPYGVAENQWSAAFAWPGQWLKSNFQMIDNTVLGVNRQGYRLRYFVDKGPLEVHAEYTDLRQIDPETTVTAEQAGYVDGYYLPQLPNQATFGRQKRYGFWTAWHPPFGDLSLDIVDDTLYRPAAPGAAPDGVSYEVPQAVLTFDRHLSSNAVVAVGLGRYAINGRFAEPIDFSQRLFFAGLEFKETNHASILVDFRRTTFGGESTMPLAGTSADFTGSVIVVEQRVHL